MRGRRSDDYVQYTAVDLITTPALHCSRLFNNEYAMQLLRGRPTSEILQRLVTTAVCGTI